MPSDSTSPSKAPSNSVITRRLLSRRLFARTAMVGGAAAALPVLADGTAQAATGTWGLNGNAGTDINTNFLGTTDNHSVAIRTNNREWVRVTTGGLVGVNTTTPGAMVHAKREGGTVIIGEYYGTANASGVYGFSRSAAASSTGVTGELRSASSTPGSAGVRGKAAGSGDGVIGTGLRGVVGQSDTTGGTGVFGTSTASNPSTNAISALATGPTSNALKAVVNGGSVSYAVWAVADAASYAGIFQGRVNIYGDTYVSGTLSKAAGSFKIDHPLDPANKYLSHSFVESPDMLNVYSGIATAGSDGTVQVTLPSYFDALNTEVRYQVTAVGAAMPNLHVSVPYADGTFTIGGAKAGLQVSWQATGVRQDAYAKAHPIVTETLKPAGERGKYLHAVALGKDERLQQTAPR